MQGEHNQMENNTLKCYLKFEFNLYQNESFEIYKKKIYYQLLFVIRLWKYEAETIGKSEFLLDSSLIETLEFDNDIFAAGKYFFYFFVSKSVPLQN